MNLPGRLRTTTLGDLLGTMHRARATGTLELAEDSGRVHRVYVSTGFVVAVEIDGAAATLGEILRRDDAVDPELLKRSLLRAMTSRRLHGDVLVRDFRVDGAIVDAALRRQLIARLERLDQLSDARVHFRVAVRSARGALVDAPLPPSQFLAGRRRARDAAGARHRAPAPRPARLDPARDVASRVLGVAPSAAPTEIRAAYRRLARTFHPDLHPQAGDEERRALAARFRAITEAYRALSA